MASEAELTDFVGKVVMRAALYMRRSTNPELQADSLRVQEELLRAYAAAHHHEVTAVFSESASGRTVDGRAEFQRLIAAVRRGARFELILVVDVSRWGRFDSPDEAGYYEWVCLSKGVRVIYINEDFVGDESPLAALQKSMKRWMAGEYSREKSRTVQRAQSRVVKLGFMHGGPAPYGLRRILVDLEGNYVGELRPGDRKALSNMRVKLAPGEPDQVDVVRYMFRAYADDKRSLKEIGDALNERGLRGTCGGRWTPAKVAYMLSNASYVGCISYTFHEGRSRSEMKNFAGPATETRVSTERAFEPIVEQDLWDRAQARLAGRTWRKSNQDLAHELREAYERWGFTEEKMLSVLGEHASWDTYANRFRNGYSEALEVAYEAEVAEARKSFETLVAAHFEVREFEGGVLLDTLLHIGFKVAWPRARRGGLFWEFEYRGDEIEDVTVGLAFTPPPTVRVAEVFLFQTAKFKAPKKYVRRKLSSKRAPNRFVLADSPDKITRYLQSAIYFRTHRAEKRLLEAVAEMPMVNVAALARQLGWQENATRVIYLKLQERGAPVPPMKGKHGRRIDVVCSVCTGSRRLTPSAAMQLRTDVCFECQNRRPNSKITVTCPDCGRSRDHWPSQVHVMKDGERSLCHECAMKKGRRIRQIWREERRPIEEEKRKVLRELASVVVEEMRKRPEFLEPVLWSRGRRRNPTLRWRETDSGQRERLTICCEDSDVSAIKDAPLTFVANCLDRTRWVPCRSDARNDAAYLVACS